MRLYIQIGSLLFSMIYGIIFYFLLEGFNKLVCKVKIIYKLLLSLIFVISLSIVYFMGLLFINNGVIHIYFLLCIMFGYGLGQVILNMWLTYVKKK